jgi:hypothetical protein
MPMMTAAATASLGQSPLNRDLDMQRLRQLFET